MALTQHDKFDIDASYSYLGKNQTFEDDVFESEIGDVKTDGIFYPQLKIKRWDNEANFSVRVKDAGHAEPSIDGDKIVYTTADYIARFYYLQEGFEFDITFPSKPSTNKVEFSIRRKQLAFYKQPALTQAQIDEGIERPDDIVGSYAVYHRSKKHHKQGETNYRAGKAFHIKRPWAEDATGRRVWCDLDISLTKHTMTITLPEEFYETAVWPVLVDPTFGYTTVGATNGGSINRAYGHGNTSQQYTASSGDSVTTYHMYTRTINATAEVGVYDLGTPGSTEAGATLLSGTATITATSASPIWETASTTVSLTASNGHFLAYASGDSIRRYFDAGVAGDSVEDSTATGGTLQSSYTISATDDEIVSLYATYTEGSSGTTVDVPVGSITLTGQVPTVTTTDNKTITIPTGSISLTGLAPTVLEGNDITVEIPTGSISLTGQVPTILTGNDVAVEIPVGSITLTGLAPTITTTNNVTVEVPTGSITLTGQAPTVVADADITIDVPTGSLTLTGYAPTVLTGDVTLTEQDIQNIVNAIFTYVVENGETFAEQLKLIRAEAAGKLLVSGTTVTIRDAADSKDRITATVDNNGQRTSVTTDAS